MTSPVSTLLFNRHTMLTNLPSDVLLTERETKILLRAIHSRDIRLVTATIIGVPRIFDELHRIISALPKIMMHNDRIRQETQGCGHSRYDPHSRLLSDEHGALDLSVQNLRKQLRPRDFYRPEGSSRSDESFHVMNPTLSPILHTQLSPPNSMASCINLDAQSSLNDANLLETIPADQGTPHNISSPVFSNFCETEEQKDGEIQQLSPTSPTLESDTNSKRKKATKLYPFPSKRPIKCDICLKVVRADNFRVHQRSHTGEKPYRCPICPFRSANPSSMPKHLKLHDKGRMIFYCDNCTHSTIYKSNLAVHIRTHHSEELQTSTMDADKTESPEKKYECIECTEEFSTLDRKISHEAACIITPVDFSTSRSDGSPITSPSHSRTNSHIEERTDNSSNTVTSPQTNSPANSTFSI